MHRQRLLLLWSFFVFLVAGAGSALGQTIVIEDASGQPVTTLLEGSRAYLRVTDAGADLDPNAIEMVHVALRSLLGQDIEDLYLTETGPATGAFTGSIQLGIWGNSSGILYTTRSGTYAPTWDTVTAEYGTATGIVTATATTLGAVVEILDTQGGPLSYLPQNGTVLLRVRDFNADTSPGADTTILRASSPVSGYADDEDVTLTETGGSSGIFEALLQISSTALASSQDGVKAVRPGDTVGFQHQDANYATLTGAQMRVYSDQAVTIQLVDANGQPVTQILQLSQLYVKVNDPASANQGWNAAVATSDIRGDQKTVYLDPDWSNPGNFRGQIYVEPKLPSQTPDSLNLAVIEDPGPPLRFDTVRVMASCIVPPCPQASVQVVPSTLRFLDAQAQPLSRVPLGSTLILEGKDFSNAAMQVTLTAQPGGDTESLYLYVVGGYSENMVFRATLPTAAGPAVPGDGVLQIDEGGTLTAVHPNYLGLSATTASILTGSNAIAFVDRQGQVTDTVWERSKARIRASSPAANLSPYGLDTLTATLVSKEVGGTIRDTETVQLLETGPDTGIFSAEVQLSAAPAGTPGDGTLATWSTNRQDLDRVVVSAGANEATANVAAARVHFLDAAGNDVSQYAVGDLVRVRVEAEGYAPNPTWADTFTVLLSSLTTGDQEYLALYETGSNTGVFEGSIHTWTGTPRGGWLDTVTGETIRAFALGLYTVDAVDQAVMVNGPPLPQNDAVEMIEDGTVSIPVLANDGSPDGTPLTVIGIPIQPLHGTAVLSGNLILYTPAPNFYGYDQFHYTVQNTSGRAAEAVVDIHVQGVDDAPVTQDDSVTMAEDTPVYIGVLDNDVDPDGTGIILKSVSQPAHGSIWWQSSGLLYYTPQANYNGPDSFTYTTGHSWVNAPTSTASVSVTVTPVNDPPVAVNDFITTLEDTPVTFNALANDTDADGDTLVLLSVATPLGGTMTWNANGSITFTPTADFSGVVNFNYGMGDGHGGSAAATIRVTITPVNDPPVAVNDQATTNEDTQVSIPVLSNDRDIEFDTLTITAITQGAHGTAVFFNGSSPSVRYTPQLNYNGTDSLTYTVSDGRGGSAVGQVNVTINAQPDPPAAGSDSATTLEDTPVTINVLANDSDPDGDTALTTAAATSPTKGTVVHNADHSFTYTPNANISGTDSFTYRVTDSTGRTATAVVFLTITAVNDLPVAGNNSATTTEDTPVTINVLTNDSDLDGDTLTITAVTQPAHGSATFTATNVTYTPAANSNGPDSFTYSISDGHGGTATATVSITVTAVNDWPVAVTDTATTAEDTPVTINVIGNDTDAEGDTLTVNGVGAPSHGTVSFTTSTVTYTPIPNYNGTDTFIYSIIDGHGGAATGTVNITVTAVNDPPAAANDSITTAEDTAATVAVLSNDTDLDGDGLTVTAVTQPAHGSTTFTATNVTYTPAANYNGPDSFTYSISDGNGRTATATVSVTVTAVNDPPTAGADSATTAEDTAVTVNVLSNDSDIEGNSLTVTAVTQPAHGSTSFTATNATYTPAANYNGPDSFTYSISDGNGGTATATVSVTVTAVNDPPAATADSTTTAEDTAVTVNVLTNDSDLDGDSLTVTAVTQPTHGSATFTSTNATYTPAANYNGPDSFTYSISDGHGGTASATVSVTVTAVNDPPVAAGDNATTAEDTAVTVNVLSNDSDIEGNNLTVTAVTQPSHGLAGFTATNATYTPAANYNGADSFTYSISDGNGGMANATVSVTVTAVNDPPVAAGDSTTTAEDTAATVNVLGNDSDLDGDSLAVTAVTQPAHGSASFTATNATYTPAANYNGADSFTYSISDGHGGIATATVSATVTAVNDSPIAANDSATTREGVAVTVSVLANDSDVEGSALTVTGVSTPAHGTAAFTASSVTYTPAANFNGIDSFTYTVGDGGTVSTGTVTVTVKDALERVAVLATNSAWIQTGADVLSGDVVVNQAGAGPFLNGTELSLAGTVTTPSGWDLDADSLTIAAGTTVASDVFFNQLTNAGAVSGQQTSSLTLPVFTTLPAFLGATPNTTDVSVSNNGTRTLAPGTYRDLIIGRKATVTFTGGIYHFRSIRTSDIQAKLLFSAASTVRVQQTFKTLGTTTIGPASGASVTAAGIVFYIGGINGTGGGITETPKAVEIGTDNVLTANIYAPNGTLWLADRTQARGSFIGKDVLVGPDVQVTLQTAWTGQ